MTLDAVLGNAEASLGPAIAKELMGCLDLIEVLSILRG